MLNSSFAYWYWRLYDGGINCPLTIINNIPVFYNILNEFQKNEINKIAEEMQKNERWLRNAKNMSNITLNC